MIRKIYIATKNLLTKSTIIVLKLQNEIRVFLLIILLCFLTINIACKTIDNEQQKYENNR
jgi:hypothetical protein